MELALTRALLVPFCCGFSCFDHSPPHVMKPSGQTGVIPHVSVADHSLLRQFSVGVHGTTPQLLSPSLRQPPLLALSLSSSWDLHGLGFDCSCLLFSDIPHFQGLPSEHSACSPCCPCQPPPLWPAASPQCTCCVSVPFSPLCLTTVTSLPGLCTCPPLLFHHSCATQGQSHTTQGLDSPLL